MTARVMLPPIQRHKQGGCERITRRQRRFRPARYGGVVALSMGIVERLVPDGLWELFQRVVPPAPVRPQGGGRRRYRDREVLAAIIFVSGTGCTWRQLPPVFGPSGPTAHRRFASGLVAVRNRLDKHAGYKGEGS